MRTMPTPLPCSQPAWVASQRSPETRPQRLRLLPGLRSHLLQWDSVGSTKRRVLVQSALPVRAARAGLLRADRPTESRLAYARSALGSEMLAVRAAEAGFVTGLSALRRAHYYHPRRIDLDVAGDECGDVVGESYSSFWGINARRVPADPRASAASERDLPDRTDSLSNYSDETVADDLRARTSSQSLRAISRGRVAYIGRRGGVPILDLRSGKLVGALQQAGETITGLCELPSGLLLTHSSKEGTLRVWDANAGTVLRSAKVTPTTITAMTTAPSGAWVAFVAAMSTSNTIHVYSTSTLALLGEIELTTAAWRNEGAPRIFLSLTALNDATIAVPAVVFTNIPPEGIPLAIGKSATVVPYAVPGLASAAPDPHSVEVTASEMPLFQPSVDGDSQLRMEAHHQPFHVQGIPAQLRVGLLSSFPAHVTIPPSFYQDARMRVFPRAVALPTGDTVLFTNERDCGVILGIEGAFSLHFSLPLPSDNFREFHWVDGEMWFTSLSGRLQRPTKRGEIGMSMLTEKTRESVCMAPLEELTELILTLRPELRVDHAPVTGVDVPTRVRARSQLRQPLCCRMALVLSRLVCSLH